MLLFRGSLTVIGPLTRSYFNLGNSVPHVNSPIKQKSTVVLLS